MKTLSYVDNRITLRHGVCRRTWLVRDHLLVNPTGGRSVPPAPCFRYVGLTDDPWGNPTIRFQRLMERRTLTHGLMAPAVEAVFRFADPARHLHLDWCFRLFAGIPGWETFVDVRSAAAPLNDWRIGNREDCLDIVPVNPRSAVIHLADFHANTDVHNDFVTFSSHRWRGGDPLYLDGNILRVEQSNGHGMLLLKLGPSRHDRREQVRGAFRVDAQGIAAMGWGIEPAAIGGDRWLRSTSLVTLNYTCGETGAMQILRAFFKQRWQSAFHSPALVTVNPWGRGFWCEHLSEPWVIQEIQAGARLNATHYQLDDGWENGGTLEHMLIRGGVTDHAFWQPHPKRFPRGFAPLAKTAQRSGINLGLWFCPDVNREYRTWQSEADLLVNYFKRYGFNLFKIDGVMHRSKQAEDNFNAFLLEIVRRTHGRVLFNLDVTAGIRLGFFHAPAFGPLFPANRYPQAPIGAPNKYFPHLTLRNFWRLSHFIPPHLIQVEIPDIFYNPAEFGDPERHGYAGNDEHAPRRYGPDYCAALALFGSPLLWLQPSRLHPELLSVYGRLMALYRRHRNAIVKGDIFPLGAEPDGRSITGLASVRPSGGGYAVFYREVARQSHASFPLDGAGGRRRLELLAASADCRAELNHHELRVVLKQPRSFALYRWK